jgi:ADP-ribose pyrophosphatase
MSKFKFDNPYAPIDALRIPAQAELVFHGRLYDTYQWPQLLFDGKTATFEMLKRPDTVNVIAVNNGKVLLIDTQQPGSTRGLALPGGRVDGDEDALKAGLRELEEETGRVFETIERLDTVQPEAKVEWFVHLCIAHGLKAIGEQNLDTGGEKANVIEVTIDEFLDLLAEGKIFAEFVNSRFLLLLLLQGKREELRALLDR